MWDFLIRVFDAEGLHARWEWSGMSITECWFQALADLATFAACTAILIALALFIRRRGDLPFPRTFWLFSGLIFALGAVHLGEALALWHPLHRLLVAIKLVVAVCAIVAAVGLVPVLFEALRLPGLEGVNTDLRRALSDRARLAAIVADSRDAILATDLDGRVAIWNTAAEELFGWNAQEVVGQPVAGLFAPRSEEGHHPDDLPPSGAPEGPVDLSHTQPAEDRQVDVVLRDGSRAPVSLVVSPIYDDETGDEAGASLIVRDVRERLVQDRTLKEVARHLRETNQKLLELVDIDPLTGLLNRRGMQRRLEEELVVAERSGSGNVALLIDCDDFKSINDRFGHEAGDVVIRQLAQRIQSSVRSTDHAARIGGDEFLVLLPETRFGEGLQLAERIRLAVADLSFAVPGEEVHCTVSIGAESVVGATTLEELMRRTGAALRRSKVAGKNLVSRHDNVHEGDVDALIGDDLEVFAQPIVAIGDESIQGFEMLVRGPEGPFRNPNDFFRACREQDVLTRVDTACLRAGLEQAKLLRAFSPRSIHVNLFPSTVEHAPRGAIEAVLLDAQELDEITIELNESMLVGDPGHLRDRLAAIRDATGVRIAIDDVGFGRSSLEALIVLEPDVVKIDRRFVAGIGDRPSLRRNLGRLLHVADALGADVVAEGVECRSERDALLALEVVLAQGYLWSRPRPVRDWVAGASIERTPDGPTSLAATTAIVPAASVPVDRRGLGGSGLRAPRNPAQ